MAAMKKGSLKSSLFLLLAAFIWGVAFVAQSVGMDYMGPFSFNGARFILGALVLLPLVVTRRQKAIKEGKEGAPFGVTLRGGILCGIALGSAALFQQFGILSWCRSPVFSLGKRPVERYGSGRLWQLSACICSV